jgi:hypothetical protein
MAIRVQVQWRKGELGNGDVYEFNPKPKLTRESPTQRLVTLEVPTVDGAIIQPLGLTQRIIIVRGYIVVSQPDFDDLMEAKKALEDGVGSEIGQLHIISNFGQPNSKHIYYKGIVDGGIKWSEQTNMKYMEYSFNILCGDPVEYEYI